MKENSFLSWILVTYWVTCSIRGRVVMAYWHSLHPWWCRSF